MDMGGIDQIGVAPSHADASSAGPVRPRTVLIALLLLVAVLAGWAAWNRSQPVERLCLNAGVVDTPTAAGPGAAFDAWWAGPGPEQVRLRSSVGHTAPAGAQPSRDDFGRLSETSWEWRYGDGNGKAIGVEVGRPSGASVDGAWTVTHVSPCSYGPFDEDNSRGT